MDFNLKWFKDCHGPSYSHRCFLLLFLILMPAATIIATSCSAHSHGFANYAQGAKATAMGGAFTAIADDPTANYYNPAGIAFMDGTQTMLGSTVFTSRRAAFRSRGSSNMPGITSGRTFRLERETNILPYMHITHSTEDGFGFGLSGYSMWGQSNSWPDHWEGRFAPGGLASEITSYRAQAVMAYAPNEKLSLAAGIYHEWIDLTMSQKLWVPMLMTELDYSLGADGSGLGWIAGALLRPHERLSLGASYRSGIRYDLNPVNIKIKPEMPALGIHGTKGRMRFATPGILNVGAALKWEKLTVAFDVYWTEWSVQDRIKVKFDQPILGNSKQVKDNNWKDTFTYGLGLEYAVNDHLRLRAGYIFDQSPVPSSTLDPMVFFGDSQLFCLGAGLKKGKLSGDFSYSRVVSKDRRFDNSSGDFPNPGGGRVTGYFRNSSLDIFIASLAYRF